jgi:Alpha/beta hydrolase family
VICLQRIRWLWASRSSPGVGAQALAAMARHCSAQVWHARAQARHASLSKRSHSVAQASQMSAHSWQSRPPEELEPLLAGRFTLCTYDRGRGDTAPSAVERETEDLVAVISAVSGGACVLGVSSGSTLALEAADRGPAPLWRWRRAGLLVRCRP